MSWPIKDELSGEFSYQVCTNCGVKRLFDEQSFRPYGHYGYDLNDLIARERLYRMQRMHKATSGADKARVEAEDRPKQPTG